MFKKKIITIIGAGNVGSHIASAGIHKNLKAEFVLVDICDEFEKAQVLDLKDTLSFSKNSEISVGDLSDSKVRKSDIFVITAGAKQEKGEDRISLLERNVEILKDIRQNLGEIKSSSIVIIVSNPVDLLTQKAVEIFGLPRKQIFGTGTSLDSSRLKWHLSENKNFKKSPERIEAYVLGEHGDSSFVCWSQIKNSQKLSNSEKDQIEQAVRDEAYEIISGKGATFFGIGATVANILEAILTNSKKVFSLSISLSGEYGQKDVSIGVLSKLGKRGIIKVLEKDFNEDEKKKFKDSAQKLKKFL